MNDSYAVPADITATPTDLDAVPEEAGPMAGPREPSTAEILVEMALKHYTLGNSELDGAFGTTDETPHQAIKLKGSASGLRQSLARMFYLETSRVASQSALQDALNVLEGIASMEDLQELNLRVGGHEGAVYIDIGDASGRVIRIRDGDWVIQDSSPVLFRRTKLTAPLAEPVRGGSLDPLWNYVAVEPEDRPLVVAWLVSALVQPHTPHAILQFLGEHGTAKSTSTRSLIDLVDPSTVPIRKAPRNEDDWVVAASGSWAVALDNLSTIADWLSDALCRASTGDGSVRRQLYTDADLAVLAFRRCIIFNGISVGGLRGDLADRVLAAELQVIPKSRRQPEETMKARWERDRPIVMGALLDLAAEVHNLLADVVLESSPRMADFAKVLRCVDDVTGWDGFGRYLGAFHRQAAESLRESPFTAALIDYRYSCEAKTAKQILTDMVEAMLPVGGGKFVAPEGWPKNTRAAGDLLMRSAPAFREIGWKLSNDSGKNKDRIRKWSLTAPEAGFGGSEDPPGGSEAGQDFWSNIASTCDDGSGGSGGSEMPPLSVWEGSPDGFQDFRDEPMWPDDDEEEVSTAPF